MSIEVVREIRTVEAEAETVIESARREAHDMVRAGEEKAQSLRRDSRQAVVSEAKALLEAAELTAESEARQLLEKAAKEANEVGSRASAFRAEAIRFITEKVVG